MKKKTLPARKPRRPLPAVIALTVISSVHFGTAWAADGGIDDAGADAATTAVPDGGARADAGDDDDTATCGATKSASNRKGMVLFGTGCC